MRIDTSEVKTYRECTRKHMYSSRNRYHLKPVAPNENLVFGTQFHEVLHMMYLGSSLDKILEWIRAEVTEPNALRMMINMATGYFEGPYQQDKDEYTVLDIEKSFEYPIGVVGEEAHPELLTYYIDDADKKWMACNVASGEIYEAVVVCGSIDMICIEKSTGKLVGFEHKTAKNFRPEVYDLVDEQPRVYSWALMRILDDYHKQGKYLEVKQTGAIYLNQVKKLLTKFDFKRSACEYTYSDLEGFMKMFVVTANKISNSYDTTPEPGYMKCQMCDYADLCMHYGYAEPTLEDLQQEFDGEFVVRDVDHLEEKAHRHNEESQ